MTIAVITLALVLAGSIVLNGVQTHWQRDSFLSQRASFAAEVMATRDQIKAETERDAFKAQALRSTAEAVEAKKKCEDAQRAANRARQELVNRVSKEVVAASPDDVVRLVDDLLSAPLPGMSDAGTAPTGTDHGDPIAASVSPASGP